VLYCYLRINGKSSKLVQALKGPSVKQVSTYSDLFMQAS
jgi:hypothetical protein